MALVTGFASAVVVLFIVLLLTHAARDLQSSPIYHRPTSPSALALNWLRSDLLDAHVVADLSRPGECFGLIVGR